MVPSRMLHPVIAAAAPRRLVVHLFARALADVADDQRAGGAGPAVVETVAPRIPQAEVPDLAQGRDRLRVDERIVGGNPVAGRVIVGDADVNPEHLAEQRERILRVVVGIVATATIAGADIEISIRPEREVAAVVIGVARMRDGAPVAGPDQIESGGGIRRQRRGRRSPESGHDDIATGTGEIDEEPPARGGVGGEGHAEQALFTTSEDDGRAQVEERGGQQYAVVEDPDEAALLDDEEPRRGRRIGDEGDRGREPLRDQLRAELGRGGHRHQGQSHADPSHQ